MTTTSKRYLIFVFILTILISLLMLWKVKKGGGFPEWGLTGHLFVPALLKNISKNLGKNWRFEEQTLVEGYQIPLDEAFFQSSDSSYIVRHKIEESLMHEGFVREESTKHIASWVRNNEKRIWLELGESRSNDGNAYIIGIEHLDRVDDSGRP